ncbi:MAG: hypothetical protein HYY42_07020 [Chloroflexi bacterium]|nr:hypothetical protein [Chloroflexota bacterium]MBI2983907.1 hypothetical protein [Chloroflexota bacterium]
MRYSIRSAGAWGDLADVRHDEADRLGFALAIFGAEATLRCVARVGTVTLYDRRGRELLAYDAERLSMLGGPFFER